MNKTQFTGRLTADPELKQTQSGVSVCSFTLAVKRPRRKDTTDFMNKCSKTTTLKNYELVHVC